MSSFICAFCVTNRDFTSFGKLFNHITVYHQHEPNFRITCDLKQSCGVLYRTYAAYKSHVYRHHLAELKSKEKCAKMNVIVTDNDQESNGNVNVEIGMSNDDINSDTDSLGFDDGSETDFIYPSVSLNISDNDKNFSEILTTLKKGYMSFVLQLREEYLLPKTVMNIISTSIATLIQQVQLLLKIKCFDYTFDNGSDATSLRRQKQKIISMEEIQQTITDVCDLIHSTTKNDYQFLKNCEKYFNYSPVEEIILSSGDEVPEYAYYIPVDKTISSLLRSSSLISEILEYIDKQRTISEADTDIMFSIRDGHHGMRLDQDTLLVQLYLDDIGLTNPIGPKRDQHKMSMLYMSLEDLPEQYRSKLDYIQLVGVCPSRILKVIFIRITFNLI